MYNTATGQTGTTDAEHRRKDTGMKGTEKQIRYAEEIINGGLNTIKRNIEICESRTNEDAQLRARIWKTELIALKFLISKATDAARVIDQKHKYEGRKWIEENDRMAMIIKNGRITIEELEAQAQAAWEKAMNEDRH